MDLSQIITPAWKDKALWAKLLAPLVSVWVAWLNQHAHLGLSDTAVTVFVGGVMANAVTYIAAHKWKTTILQKALIAADAGQPVNTPTTAPAAPKAGGFTSLRFCLLMVLISGCATLKLWWNSTVDCAKEDAPSILAKVPDILSKLADQDWVNAALDTGQVVGNVEACALESVRQAGLQNHPAVTPKQAANAQALSASINKPAINAPPIPLAGP